MNPEHSFTGIYDQGIKADIINWCVNQFGSPQGWQINWWRNQRLGFPSEQDTHTFAFANEDNLVFFKLCWADHVL